MPIHNKLPHEQNMCFRNGKCKYPSKAVVKTLLHSPNLTAVDTDVMLHRTESRSNIRHPLCTFEEMPPHYLQNAQKEDEDVAPSCSSLSGLVIASHLRSDMIR